MINISMTPVIRVYVLSATTVGHWLRWCAPDGDAVTLKRLTDLLGPQENPIVASWAKRARWSVSLFVPPTEGTVERRWPLSDYHRVTFWGKEARYLSAKFLLFLHAHNSLQGHAVERTCNTDLVHSTKQPKE